MKIQLVIIAIWLITHPVGLMAEESFCQNSYDFICHDAAERRVKREKEVREEIKKEAKLRAKKQLKEEGGLTAQYATDGVYSWLEEYLLYEANLYEVAKEKLENFEKDIITKENVKEVKRLFKLAIQRSSLTNPQKKRFKRIINKTIVGSVKDLKVRAHFNRDFELLDAYKRYCGSDGWQENAFTTRTRYNRRYILICPGWLITLNKTKSKTLRLYNIFQVLSHELGHHIDADDFPEVYKNFKKCNVDHYASKFNKTKKDAKKCERLSKDKCNQLVVDSHADELIAETWSTQVMALYMRENKLSVAESESLLKESLLPSCGSSDEGIHPSTRFVIEKIFRKSPAIKEQLGCPMDYDNKSPWCGPHGELTLI